MAQPVISWYDATNVNPITAWNIGTVDAGHVSPDVSFLIWNNRGGGTALSDATQCTITTVDASGGNTGDVITDKWIEVKVDTMNESTFTAIGGTTTKDIKAGGTNAGAGVIKGTANNGTTQNSADNFAKVTLHANVPANAVAGNRSFMLRVSYHWV